MTLTEAEFTGWHKARASPGEWTAAPSFGHDGFVSAYCAACGETGMYVRARFEILVGRARLVAEEVPSVHCGACGRTDPAAHAQPQLNAVIEIAQELAEETADEAFDPALSKDFTAMPLEPVNGHA